MSLFTIFLIANATVACDDIGYLNCVESLDQTLNEFSLLWWSWPSFGKLPDQNPGLVTFRGFSFISSSPLPIPEKNPPKHLRSLLPCHSYTYTQYCTLLYVHSFIQYETISLSKFWGAENDCTIKMELWTIERCV